MKEPSDLAALKSAIASQSIALSYHHLRIVRVAFERPELIAFGTASSVADIFAVSPSTVMRLTKALGFARFRDFRTLFREHLRTTAAIRRTILL